MSNNILTCPFCQFTKEVTKSSILQNAQWVTCPKCQNRFLLSPLTAKEDQSQQPSPSLSEPVPTGVELGGDLCKPQNLQFAVLFLVMFIAILGGRLYSSNRALNTPSPNFIAASENGIATLWLDQVLITDQEGTLVRKVDIPENLEPTQILWAGDELWVADYRTKKILIVDANNQRWLELKGPKIAAHFKVAPDFPSSRIFVSNGAGHNLLIYDLQGNFRSSFGREGRNPGEFMFPNQFLLEESGNLLIANTKSPAIDRYSPEGQFLARIVTPTGDANYRYPTNVALAPDRIITLETDGYLRDGRIALYTRHGKYLGSQELLKDFKLIGDIAVWENRVLATDLANAKVYAFAAEDLHFLGEYSNDLKRLGEKYQKDFRFWDNLSGLCLWGLLAILAPLIYFYARSRKNQAGGAKAHHLAPEDVSWSQRENPLDAERTNSTYLNQKRHLNRKAALLSALFPGLGQFYKRHLIRGALFMALFTPVALSVAINFEPILVGAIDWVPVSIIGMGTVLSYGFIVFAINIWDALTSQ